MDDSSFLSRLCAAGRKGGFFLCGTASKKRPSPRIIQRKKAEGHLTCGRVQRLSPVRFDSLNELFDIERLGDIAIHSGI